MLRASGGARNCPFFTLTARPDFAAARIKSVCRQRNAGICSTSATAATSSICATSCTSVSTGTFSASLTLSKIFSPACIPSPRKLLIEERFALSNEVLKTKSRPALRARTAHSRAIINVCSSDSMTHGPAITVSRPSPNVAGPTLNDLFPTVHPQIPQIRQIKTFNQKDVRLLALVSY